MSKEDLKIKPVEKDVTKEDLKKINGGNCPEDSCGGGDNCSSYM